MTKLRAKDGVVQGIFDSGGNYPFGLLFDGRKIWVSNPGYGWDEDTVTILRARDGAFKGSSIVNPGPGNFATDGKRIWVLTSMHNIVVELRANDAARLNTYPINRSAGDILYDGANLWVTNQREGTVTKISRLQP